MHKDDQRHRGLGSVYILNGSTHSPSDRPLSGGLCCFIFTHIHSLFLSFPLLDLRLGSFSLLVRQMLEPCYKGCQRIW